MGDFMRLEKRRPSGREKDEASVKLLAQLREKLYSEHIGSARRAAFNLSWLQEDGLEILKEAVFSRASRRTKSAAAYGLRKMRGRMEKAALEVLSQGLKHPDKTTVAVCQNALLVLKSRAPARFSSKVKIPAGQFEIKQVPAKGRASKASQTVASRRNRLSK